MSKQLTFQQELRFLSITIDVMLTLDHVLSKALVSIELYAGWWQCILLVYMHWWQLVAMYTFSIHALVAMYTFSVQRLVAMYTSSRHVGGNVYF